MEYMTAAEVAERLMSLGEITVMEELNITAEELRLLAQKYLEVSSFYELVVGKK